MGDLAGFSSAIILAMIALLIAYEAVTRLLAPAPIHFSEAIPIAVVGLLVNVTSAWLLSGDHHQHHSHDHHHHHRHTPHEYAGDDHEDTVQRIFTPTGIFALSIFEDGVPPVFRLNTQTHGSVLPGQEMTVTTIRPAGSQQVFAFKRVEEHLESTSEIQEPHAFKAIVRLQEGEHFVEFEEHQGADDAGDRVHPDPAKCLGQQQTDDGKHRYSCIGDDMDKGGTHVVIAMIDMVVIVVDGERRVRVSDTPTGRMA